jgi:hypothetical protein
MGLLKSTFILSYQKNNLLATKNKTPPSGALFSYFPAGFGFFAIILGFPVALKNP